VTPLDVRVVRACRVTLHPWGNDTRPTPGAGDAEPSALTRQSRVAEAGNGRLANL